jgi:hypothetical protein
MFFQRGFFMQDLIRKAGEIVLVHMDDVGASVDDVLVLSGAMRSLAEAYNVASVGEAEYDESDECYYPLSLIDEAEDAHAMLSSMGVNALDDEGKPFDLSSRIWAAIMKPVEPVDEILE